MFNQSSVPNLEFFFMILLAIFIGYTIYLLIVFKYQKKENIKLKKEIDNLTYEKIDFKYAADAMQFIDSLIELKFSYHLYSTLMPIYVDKKIPEKSQINEIKEKIYVSVVGSLSKSTKRSVLGFFNEKGIEIYIHEKIINLMNRTDIINTDKYNDSFKDAKGDKLTSLMP